MKKLFTLALGLFLLVSCSSDDSGNSTIDTSLLTNKKWYPSSTVIQGQTIPYEHENINCGKDYSMFMVEGVYKDVYLTMDCTEYVSTGTWVISGNTITTNESGDINSGTITKLTASELHVLAGYDIDDDGQEDGTATLVFSTN